MTAEIDADSMPVAIRSVRLRTLQRALERAESHGNIMIAARMLELAALEMGAHAMNGQPQSPTAALTIVLSGMTKWAKK